MQISKKLNELSRKPIFVGFAIVLLVVVVVLFIKSNAEIIEEAESIKPLVTVITPAAYSGKQELSLIGNVRAFTEAKITTEKSAQVTSVRVSLGDQVKAGQIIATLENSSEQASVLQAEGVYEAAVAASAQSTVSVSQAKIAVEQAQNTLITTLKNSYNTTYGVVVTTIDDFFSDPNSFVPGVKIDAKGNSAFLNNERVVYQTLLPEWNGRVNSLGINSDYSIEIDYAKTNINRTIALIDVFLNVFDQQTSYTRYTETELQQFTAEFSGVKSSLISQLAAIDNAKTSLDSAIDGLSKAELAASGGTNSASDAQVKQALGALRSAQANLSKTILRSPISGTVNSLSVKVGDYVNVSQQVALVANNEALEVVTYVSDSEKELINEGDEVTIENNLTGIITQISPAVDGQTKKTEVRISTEGTNITNGDTVRITKNFESVMTSTSKIIVPLTAVRFEIENGFIFTVEEGRLVQKSVELGLVRGSSVEVVTGLNFNDQFVVDVRGLLPEQEVDVK